MKPINRMFLLAGLAGGLCAAGSRATAQTTPAPGGAPAGPTPVDSVATPVVTGDASTSAPGTNASPALSAPAGFSGASVLSDLAAVRAMGTNAAADFAAGKGLRMNFRQIPLQMVLTYLSTAAGFIIHTERNVNVDGKVDVWSDQPMSKPEAVNLLKQMLSENGYGVLENGRMLTIFPTSTSRQRDVKINVAKDPGDIPKSSEIVTEIIPVRSLNVVQLAKDLAPMLETTLTAQESGNSLIMTDTQINVRRIVEIVKALDAVSSSVNQLRVFPLVHADAKTIASMIKDLFPSADGAGRSGGGSTGGQRFGSRGGGGGGRGGGGPFGGGGGGPFGGMAAMFGGAGGGGDSAGSTPTTRVSAVSDDHSNSVIVSAPDDLMALVEDVIKQVDVEVQDITEVKVFKLKNADAMETADLLYNLFPDDSNPNSASSQQFTFGGFGGLGGRGGGATGGRGATGARGAGTGSSSDRMQKLGRVVAVPDRRTASIVVSAAKQLMPAIEKMIQELDGNPAKKTHLFTFSLQNADPQDILPILQDLVPMSTTSGGGRSGSSSTTQSNPLLTRQTTLLQQQNSTTTTSFGTSGGGGGGRGGN